MGRGSTIIVLTFFPLSLTHTSSLPLYLSLSLSLSHTHTHYQPLSFAHPLILSLSFSLIFLHLRPEQGQAAAHEAWLFFRQKTGARKGCVDQGVPAFRRFSSTRHSPLFFFHIRSPCCCIWNGSDDPKALQHMIAKHNY